MFILKSIHFQVDNMSALLYVMKMGEGGEGGGSTQNKEEMIAISKEILEFALSKWLLQSTCGAFWTPGQIGLPEISKTHYYLQEYSKIFV